MNYTQKEVIENIETLSNRIDELKRARTELTKNINSMKKQVEKWQDLDLSQTKLI